MYDIIKRVKNKWMEKIMPKISVIIPVYNTEKYLNKCLDSLINQTYKDIEIILVNDGSTDNSLNILRAECVPYFFIGKMPVI